MKIKSKREFWIKCRYPIIYIIILLCLLISYIAYVIELDNYYIKFKRDLTIDDSNNRFLVKTAGCRIPSFHPFDKSITKFIYNVKPFTCSKVLPLVESDLNSVYINEQQLPYYNVSNQDTLSCCYQPFWRDDPKGDVSDDLYKFGECTQFESSAKINEEYVRIICKSNKTEIYKDFHGFVPIKKNSTKDDTKLKVLVFGIDSLSRSNFYRKMPLTQKYLKQLNAIEMIGYNKIGDNTFPNLIPILTGLTIKELKQKCWPTDESKFDNCDYIWKNYSKAGYLTAFGEDSAWAGIFSYQKYGFTKQPTDYYWRTFNLLAEQESGHNKKVNFNLCIGPRPQYAVLLDYVKKFALSLRYETYFGFFWGTSLTHDNINLPQLGDKYYKQLFQNLNETNILNDTILIMLSDHGMRWGGIRFTHQGHLEERLPCLYFIFPPWFIEKYSSAVMNLRRNTKRLTTPFDLHETLLDFINTEQITDDNIKQRSKDLYNKRGISLFLPVPENRTCSSANISSHWCTCQKGVKMNSTNTIVQNAGEYIVSYINELLKDYKSCATLHLNSIVDARLSVSNDYLKNNTPIHDYTVILKTKPGGALFEGTVRCVNCEMNNSFSLTGTISRINLYRNQGACIAHYHLKLYCYCGS